MSRKGIFGIIIAILIFALLVLSIETTVSLWQVVLGFLFSCGITLVFTNLRNALMLFTITLLLLLIVYLSIKYAWLGILPGVIVGVCAGLFMHFGWIVPHKPFSRSGYIGIQKTFDAEAKESDNDFQSS